MILTDANFEKEVSASDKLVIVDFFATWCEPCTMLAPILEKVAESFKDKVVLMKVNLDDAPATAGKFGVERIPTVIMFKAGRSVSGFTGLIPEHAIKEWIEKGLKENKMEEPDVARMIERYENYATSNGFRLNPDRKTVERVIKGLFTNEKKYGKKYCPCRRVTGDESEDAKKICPCAFHKDEIKKDGHCICNLFVQ